MRQYSIRFKISMLVSNLWDYNDAYIVVKGIILLQALMVLTEEIKS